VKFRAVSVEIDEHDANPWATVTRGISPGDDVVVKGGILLSQRL
jgi:hypothetical protein